MIVRQRNENHENIDRIRALQRESMELIRQKVLADARIDEIVKEIRKIEEEMKK